MSVRGRVWLAIGLTVLSGALYLIQVWTGVYLFSRDTAGKDPGQFSWGGFALYLAIGAVVGLVGVIRSLRARSRR